MSKYTPHNSNDEKEMLAKIGVHSFDDLYAHVPNEIRIDKLNIKDGLSQFEVEKEMNALAKENKVYSTILLGGGAESHYIPAVVREMSNRPEFVTAYTPYQAEISQGILQGIFEYQSNICDLTQMDVSNASVYDGGTAIAEAVLMTTEVKKNVLVANDINPQYLSIIKTYCTSKGLNLIISPTKNGSIDFESIDELLNDKIACVVVQNPNYFGLFEDVDKLFSRTKSYKAKCIYAFNAILASIIKTPKASNADIAVAEGQPLGLPLSFGGPYLGILACTKELSRKMPGRVVGQTVDKNNKRCFVLTMQAREQHIRREKALSSICSNQALCALTASMYLSCVGKKLKDVAKACVNNAHYFANEILNFDGISLKYTGEFGYEFVTIVPDAEKILSTLCENDILGGLKLSNTEIMWCVTEKVTKAELDKTISIIGGCL